VRVADDEWRARVAVVTVGGWAEPVLGAAKYGMPPLVVTEEVVSHFTPRDPNREWPSFIHYGDRLDAYGLRTPGEGVKVGGHHSGAVVTADGRTFVLDRVGPLVIGSACSGHGFKFTPIVGRILADLAEGVPNPLPRFRLNDS